jgi:hypothetical protein
MTRRQIDLYPVVFGPSATIDATKDEDLAAPAVPRHRRTTSPRTARAHRRLEAAALCAAVLTCGVIAMAHEPRGTPSLVPIQAASLKAPLPPSTGSGAWRLRAGLGSNRARAHPQERNSRALARRGQVDRAFSMTRFKIQLCHFLDAAQPLTH